MPNKYPEKKGWKVPKQKYKVSNWSEYNQALHNRGSIEFWIDEEASDFAILVCHEVRQVYRLPLRQNEGFINSVFTMMQLPLESPDYSCLCKRLGLLEIASPRYKKLDVADPTVAGIAIDSSGLKRFGRDEWHQEKHKVSGKRSWRKLHIAVDTEHRIHACELTDRFVSDVGSLLPQIEVEVSQLTGDGAYDKNRTYEELEHAFPSA